MKNLNRTLFVWLLVAVSFCVWVVLAWMRSLSSSDIAGLLKLLPGVVSVDCILLGLFAKWGWRWRFLYPWLVPFPNLNGIWKGEIQSTPCDNETQNAAPIAATLAIRQTFTGVSCVMETEEMRSLSALAGFDLDVEKQHKQLVYVYCSRPKLTVTHKSPMHDGAAVFDILNDRTPRLSGRYWTTRGTRGQMEFRRSKRKVTR